MNSWLKRIGWFGLAYAIGWVGYNDESEWVAKSVGVIAMGVGMLWAFGNGLGVDDWLDRVSKKKPR